MTDYKGDGITRRDFIGGVALGLTPGGVVSPFSVLANGPVSGQFYPPGLTGMRGNHKGSFEAAHALAWEGNIWPEPATITDEIYDLIVVGAGLSGLASAHLYLQKNPEARILLLDNHDDFGGHAKRNEFKVNGKTLIGYGGSQSIDGPALYSPQAQQILVDLGVEVDRFYRYYDQDFYQKHQMTEKIFFDKAHFEAARLEDNFYEADEGAVDHIINRYPLSPEDKNALRYLWRGQEDYLAGNETAEKITLLRSVSYEGFLRDHARMPEDVISLLRNIHAGFWGLGFDALSALEAYRLEMPGFDAMELGPVPKTYSWDQPYIFHFPDGNASLARLLVRRLIPETAQGRTMEDIVRSKFDYGQLDQPTSMVRIRLSATVVKVENRSDGEAVDAFYLQKGEVEKVRARHVIMACNNNILPHICPDMPEKQIEALKFPEKVPLTYINVALTNWRAFKRAGCSAVHAPHGFFHDMVLDFPVSMGGYDFSSTPDQPILLHMVHTPLRQGEGLSAREQHRQGRHDIYNMSFADYETEIRRHLEAILGPYGFNFDDDIAAITVNRWPHGYAYEYNELWEPWDWVDGKHAGPHIIGRQKMGRVSIANSDSEASAYVNAAFDAAYRAVEEQGG
ncbi:NAD(P)/FAD-dependent oxidoreductase [Paremcibacter congregatus]|uniref:Twin-arginine translocation pathway signal n=1 Tax=Paremcibacter congregatus TaxID=2043170 RepID=A0A2G4YSH7_9PROT|nr:NAD(P)/FAD-dependent oxidoreductase [Paremcibacter congregatus]PHZ85217.1 twin-arginine translocation pathway signal [Paremcibacter congregatus]QDE27850.1 NAD(P)/FAD-dependent oxidoreductase [Paremcibacter congregatus]